MFQRHVLDGWFMMMDLGKPIIAQVHGYCLAGGSELAAACDIIVCGEGAKIGAGSVVLEDVTAHTTVVGVPAKQVGIPSHRKPSQFMDHEIPLHYEI